MLWGHKKQSAWSLVRCGLLANVSAGVSVTSECLSGRKWLSYTTALWPWPSRSDSNILNDFFLDDGYAQQILAVILQNEYWMQLSYAIAFFFGWCKLSFSGFVGERTLERNYIVPKNYVTERQVLRPQIKVNKTAIKRGTKKKSLPQMNQNSECMHE